MLQNGFVLTFLFFREMLDTLESQKLPNHTNTWSHQAPVLTGKQCGKYPTILAKRLCIRQIPSYNMPCGESVWKYCCQCQRSVEHYFWIFSVLALVMTFLSWIGQMQRDCQNARKMVDCWNLSLSCGGFLPTKASQKNNPDQKRVHHPSKKRQDDTIASHCDSVNTGEINM